MTENHAGAFTMGALGWIQKAPGKWERWLIRRCITCHHFDWMKLLYVDARYMTCLACLSQNVEYEEVTDMVRCLDCNALSEIELTGDDDDEGEPPDDWKASER